MGIFAKILVIAIVCMVLLSTDVVGRPHANTDDQLVKLFLRALDGKKVRIPTDVTTGALTDYMNYGKCIHPDLCNFLGCTKSVR